MSDITLGIIGGGQLGSLLSVAANKLNINTVIFSDDKNSPAKNFTKNFISGNYDDEKLIKEFLSKVNVITYEFENIPYKILKKLNEIKPVLPKPEINKLIQNRYTEKDEQGSHQSFHFDIRKKLSRHDHVFNQGVHVYST